MLIQRLKSSSIIEQCIHLLLDDTLRRSPIAYRKTIACGRSYDCKCVITQCWSLSWSDNENKEILDVGSSLDARNIR